MPFDDATGSSAPPAFGTFRVLHQTGSGVLGPVFRAWDQQRDRLVTVKAIKLDLLPEQVPAVAGALRQLAAVPRPHPALVQLIDAGFEGTTPFLVMECVTGETLDIVLRMLASASLSRAVDILRPLAEAVDASWQTLGGHGALHPRDVFVGESGDDLRLTGAGIVAALRGAGVEVAPRRPYAAPERAGTAWDQRADVYSVAAIAHELLTRRRPANAHEQDGVFAPEITAAQRVAIRRVLARGLADRPEARYPTAVALIEALASVKVETQSALPFAASPEQEVAPVVAIDPGALPDEILPPSVAIDVPTPTATISEFVGEGEREAAGAATAAEVPVVPAVPVVPVVPVVPAVPVETPAIAEVVDHPLTIDRSSPWRPIDEPLPLTSAPLFGTHATSPVSADSKRRIGLGLAATVAVVAGGALVYGIWRRTVPVSDAATAPKTTTSAQGPADTEVKIGPRESAPPSTDPTVPVAPPPAASAPSTAKPGAARPAAAAVSSNRGPDATPAALPSGRIVVRSSPAGAMVTIDGRVYNDTPVNARDLALGTHVVQIARPGFVPQVQRVTLTPASPARTLTVTLVPGLSQTGDARPGPPPGRGSGMAGMGALDVDVLPRGARVTIDGERHGVTPMRVPELKAGVHTVTVEFDGYQPRTTRVTVEAGKRATVKLTLLPIRQP